MGATERRERTGEEAAEWWERLNAGEPSREDREEFVDWLRESHVHVAEMLRLAQLHDALGQFDAWSRLGTSGSSQPDNVVALSTNKSQARGDAVPGIKRPAWFRTGRRLSAIAAAVVALAIAGLWVFADGSTIATERGERREVTLADGSVVLVDPQTRLRIDFDSKSRKVTLQHGRALFRVARNPGRPFLVYASDTVVRVVGTAFGVERLRGQVVVTVAEGKVAVAADERRPALPEVLLSAGQQLVMQRNDSPRTIRDVDSGRELAWADGRLVFNNHTVAQAIEEFNRYNHVQLHVTDESLAHRSVSGIFDSSAPESFVAFIQIAASVHVERDEGNDITISSAR